MALITAKASAETVADAGEADQRIDAGDRDRERHEIARASHADQRDRDRRDELDRGDGRERQPLDREIEDRIHRREDGAERDDDQQRPPIGAQEEPPRPPPEREDDRRRRDPEPRDAERLDQREEQHREGRAEIVEDRADEEEGVRRDAVQFGRRRGSLLRLSTWVYGLRQRWAVSTGFHADRRPDEHG